MRETIQIAFTLAGFALVFVWLGWRLRALAYEARNFTQWSADVAREGVLHGCRSVTITPNPRPDGLP
jgi:hypothetical protein